jgi:hypothetical protein
VGRDKYADTLRDAAQQAGLRVEYRVDEEHPTGRCGVIITGHDRSMCTDLAAANHYKLEHLKQPHIWELVQQARIYYVGGYHLTVCVPAIMALAEEAAEKNKVCAHTALSGRYLCLHKALGRGLLLDSNLSHIWVTCRDVGGGFLDLRFVPVGALHPTILQGPAGRDGAILGLCNWE